MRQPFFTTASLLALGLCSMLSLVSAQQTNPKHPYRFLIPEGYVGWVRVDFDVKGAAALPIEDGYYIVKIPDTGRLQTSSTDMLARWDEFYYFAGDAKYRLAITTQEPVAMIQNRFMGPAPGDYYPPHHYRYFFVGPTAEYEKCKWNQPCGE